MTVLGIIAGFWLLCAVIVVGAYFVSERNQR
ncbi:MAG: hypothetical protein JWP56_84 [Aeromicrobium sp.]|jgi:hypothetical protein|nr:hypothetical protein [Aeromicrobium sp.]